MTKIKKTSLYSLAIVLSVIILGELFSRINSKQSVSRSSALAMPTLDQWQQDPITDWRPKQNSLYDSYHGDPLETDKHSIFKTPYQYEAGMDSPSEVVLVTGNSTAVGVGSSQMKYTFPSMIESKLTLLTGRQHDVHNLAVFGFNSWQEHAEIVRYVASYQYNNDLLKPTLVISLSGTQDFWSYVHSLSVEKDNCGYRCAGYLMYPPQTFVKHTKISNILESEFSATINAFFAMIVRNSYFFADIYSICRRGIQQLAALVRTESTNEIHNKEIRDNNNELVDRLRRLDMAVETTSSVIVATNALLHTLGIDYLFVHQPLLSSSVSDLDQARHDSEMLRQLETQDLFVARLRKTLTEKIPDSYIDLTGAHYPNGYSYYVDTSHYNDEGVSILVDKLLQNHNMKRFLLSKKKEDT